jgi:hypothetical protein
MKLLPINIGNFKWKFIGTSTGNVKLTVYAKNSSGLEISKKITISVLATNFDLTAITSSTTGNVNTNIPVNFTLTKNGSEAVTYQMTYSSSANGKFTYGGTEYTAGQQITVTPGNYSGTYKGTVAGQHNINFTVSASNSVTKSDNININLSTPYDYSANITIPNSSIYTNTDTNVNIELTEIVGNSTYSAKFITDNGGTQTQS